MKKIADSVILGKDVFLNDFINLYGCTIGDQSKIGPFVEIQKNASVGKNCKIQRLEVFHSALYKSPFSDASQT